MPHLEVALFCLSHVGLEEHIHVHFTSPLCTSLSSLSFIPGLKPTSFTNPTPPPVISLLPSGLPPRTFAWTVSSELLGFYFMFSLFFVSGPCARLSWPSRQLLSARYRTVSYRIVSFIVITDHVQITPTPLSLRLKEIYLYEPCYAHMEQFIRLCSLRRNG